jgi:hypothetical protein
MVADFSDVVIGIFGIIPHKLSEKKAQILSINLRFLLFSSESVLAARAAIEMNPYKFARRMPSFYAKIWQRRCQQGHSGITVLPD